MKWAAENKRELKYIEYLSASSFNGKDYQIEDFAKARNVYVEYLEDKVDFIMTMSAGSYIKEPEKIMDIISNTKADVITFDVLRGGARFKHHRLWRTRSLFDNNLHKFRYKGMIHEYLQYTGVVEDSGMEIVHEAGNGKGQESSIKRNVRLCKKMCLEEPSNRSWFYYANALKDDGQHQAAANAYIFYISNYNNFRDERMYAYLYLMRCLIKMKDYNAALHYGWRAMHEDLRFSEISYEMGKIYYELQNWNYATAMCFLCLKDKPKSLLFIEEDKYRSAPLKLIEQIEEKKHGKVRVEKPVG